MTQTPNPSSAPVPPRASLLIIFLIVFIDLMGFGILLPNQQYYGELFGLPIFWLIMIGPSYSLFQFLFAPILGKWSDRIGRRPVLILSQIGTLFGFAVLFAAHYFTGNLAALGITLLFASRIIDGISGGNISTASAYIADITTPENRAKAYGLLGAAFGLGFTFGPLIGAVAGGHFGIQAVPVTAAIFSFTALLMTLTILPESLPPEKRALAKGLPAATVFHAVIDKLFSMRLALARPVVGTLILVGFVNGFAFAGMEQTLSLLVQVRLGLTNAADAAKACGYLFGGIGIIIVLIQGGFIRPLLKRFGEVPLVITGPILTAIGLAVIGFGYAQNQWAAFATGCAFMAVGSSLFNPSISGLISRHAGESEQGEILGANQGMASLARAIGPILAGFLCGGFAAQDLLHIPVLPRPGLPYFVSAGLTLLVALYLLATHRKLRPPTGV
jgi:MFS transporter, DHA1 family, tetracycline resistance protein